MLRLHRLLSKPLSSSSSILRPPVAIFWDLSTSKPPTSLPAYDVAVRLHLTASSFGPLSLSLAYPTSHSFLPLHHHSQPQPQLQHRLHSSSSPHLCRICNRNFSDRPKLINHFHQIHTSEHTKRLNRLNSLRSTRRANLAAKLSLKIKKYQKAAREILALNESVPFNLADELKRAGVLVRKVEDGAIGDDIVEEMDRRRFGCMVLVSGDEGFVGVVKEAERRGVMTVVVGEGEGVLRRCADVGFSWKDVVLGKARKAAGNAVGRWKDKGLLKVLEWRYKEEEEEDKERSECDDDDGFEAESEDDNGSLNLVGNEGNVPWWKIDQDQQVQSSKRNVSFIDDE